MIIPFYSFFFLFSLYFSVFGSISGKQIRGNLSLDFPYLGCVGKVDFRKNFWKVFGWEGEVENDGGACVTN